MPGTNTVPGGLLTEDVELLLLDLCPKAAARPPASAPPIRAMIRNFWPPPPVADAVVPVFHLFVSAPMPGERSLRPEHLTKLGLAFPSLANVSCEVP